MASESMLDFLRAVDEPRVERSVAKVGAALLAVEIFEAHELFGVGADHICSALSKLDPAVELTIGSYGLLMRAIARVFASNAPAALKNAEQAQTVALSDLKEALGKKDKVNVHIEVAPALKDMHLGELPFDSHPLGFTVDKLASQVARLKNQRVVKPFVCVDLKDFLPYWCEETKTSGSRGSLEEEMREANEADDDKPKPKAESKRRLNLLQWFVAFEQYAIAADVCKQWSFSSAMAHKRVCCEAGARAAKTNKRHYVAIIYDQLARRRWSDAAYALGESFSVDQECLRFDWDIYQDAIDIYSAEQGQHDGNNKRTGDERKGKGKGDKHKGHWHDYDARYTKRYKGGW